VPTPERQESDAEESASGRFVYYPGDHVFRAYEMSQRDWRTFTSDPDLEAPLTRWGPENDWRLPVEHFDFLTADQLDTFVNGNNVVYLEPEESE
jgi:hypothetical protein